MGGPLRYDERMWFIWIIAVFVLLLPVLLLLGMGWFAIPVLLFVVLPAMYVGWVALWLLMRQK